MPFARIFMEGTNPDEEETLTIHVLIDSDGMANGKYPYSGWRGRPRTEHWCWPVVISPKGKVDHGGDWDASPAKRYSSMNIYDRPFLEGSVYIMRHNDGSPETEFLLKKVTIEADQ